MCYTGEAETIVFSKPSLAFLFQRPVMKPSDILSAHAILSFVFFLSLFFVVLLLVVFLAVSIFSVLLLFLVFSILVPVAFPSLSFAAVFGCSVLSRLPENDTTRERPSPNIRWITA